MTARRLTANDQATIARARKLAAAIAGDAEALRSFYREHGQPVLAETLSWPNTLATALGTAQELLLELARLAEQPDQPGTLDYMCAKVAEMHAALVEALRALVDDVDPVPALRRLGDGLAHLAALNASGGIVTP